MLGSKVDSILGECFTRLDTKICDGSGGRLGTRHGSSEPVGELNGRDLG